MISSAIFVLFCSFFFNVSTGYCLFDDFFEKRKILKWNESNASDVHIVEAKTINYRKKTTYSDEYDYFFGFMDLTIKNNTNDIIQNIIMTIEFLSNEKVVLKKNVCLNINIFPTAHVKVNQSFLLSSLFGGVGDELYNLKQQLGNKYGWNFGKIIFIPKLESLSWNPVDSLDIKIDCKFDYDSDKQITK